MARRANKAKRKQQTLQETAIKLLTLGAVFVLGPLFMGTGPLASAFKSFSGFGFLFLAGGGAMLWWANRSAEPQAVASPSAPSRPTKPTPVAPQAPAAAAAPPLETPTATETPTRPTDWYQPVLEVIEWRRFEALVETLFQQGGFITESQSHGADGGVDIRLYSRNQPGAAVSLVQCKHWKTKRVGVDKVRELRGVLAAEGVERGQLVCSTAFTPEAQAFAKDNGVNLLGAEELLSLIRKRSPEQRQALLDVALEGEYWKPTCASCGVKMVERAPRGGGRKFWGCANYPKCRNVIQVGEK